MLLTIGVSDVDIRDTTSLCIDVIGPIEEHNSTLDEPIATGQVERGVSLMVTHKWVGIGLQQVLDNFVLPCQHCQVQGGL